MVSSLFFFYLTTFIQGFLVIVCVKKYIGILEKHISELDKVFRPIYNMYNYDFFIYEIQEAKESLKNLRESKEVEEKEWIKTIDHFSTHRK